MFLVFTPEFMKLVRAVELSHHIAHCNFLYGYYGDRVTTSLIHPNPRWSFAFTLLKFRASISLVQCLVALLSWAFNTVHDNQDNPLPSTASCTEITLNWDNMAFSFGFSGDDIDIDDSEINNDICPVPSQQNVGNSLPELVRASKNDMNEWVSGQSI